MYWTQRRVFSTQNLSAGTCFSLLGKTLIGKTKCECSYNSLVQKEAINGGQELFRSERKIIADIRVEYRFITQVR